MGRTIISTSAAILGCGLHAKGMHCRAVLLGHARLSMSGYVQVSTTQQEKKERNQCASEGHDGPDSAGTKLQNVLTVADIPQPLGGKAEKDCQRVAC